MLSGVEVLQSFFCIMFCQAEVLEAQEKKDFRYQGYGFAVQNNIFLSIESATFLSF